MSFYHYQEQPTSSYRTLDSGDYELVVRQQPKEALVTQPGKEKNRKPIDPPPIIELKVSPSADPTRQFLQSPYLFMQCSLLVEPGSEGLSSTSELITGQTVSSLHRLKDINNEDGGFFVFGDISARVLGRHKLSFSLFELRKETGEVAFLKSITSDHFDVVQQKQWRGLEESTHLSRTFSDQGVRLRLRKENRGMAGQKRSFPFTSPQSSVQAGPSSTAIEQSGPASIYGSAPSLGGHYAGYGEMPPKRQRSEAGDYGQPQAFPPSDRPIPTYDTRGGPPPMQPGYSVQTAGSRQSPQAPYGLQTPIASSNWQQQQQQQHQQQQYYTPGSSSAPARVMESNVRAAQGLTPTAPYGLPPGSLGSEAGETYGRRGTDPFLSLHPPTAQGAQNEPYQGTTGPAMYAQQTSSSLQAPTSFIESAESTAMARQHTHHTQSAGSPHSSAGSVLNQPPPGFAIQQPLQPSLQPPQGYGSYNTPQYHGYQSQAQPYRPQSTYQPSTTSLLQEPLTSPNPNVPLRSQQPEDPYAQQQTHQYSAMGPGYHQTHGSGVYPTTQPQDHKYL